MDEMDHAAVIELVYRRLLDAGFRRRLKATASDGSRPILVARRDDLMSAVINRISAVGNTANVVIPTLNGVIVLAMETGPEVLVDMLDTEALTGDCTLGVVLARLPFDAPDEQAAAYNFVTEGADHSRQRGEAQVIALAG